MKAPKLSSILPVLSYLLFALVALTPVLTSPGVIAYRDDWEIPPLPQQFDTGLIAHLFAWNPQQILGIIYSVGADTYYWIFLAIVGQLGGEFASKFLIVFLMTLAGSGGYYLGRVLKGRRSACWISGGFYMMTPYLFHQMMGGVLNSLLSYGLAPIFVGLLVRSFGTGRIRDSYLTGVVFALALTYVDYVIMLPLIGLLLTVAWQGRLLQKVRMFFISGAVALSIQLFWIIPIINDLLNGSIVLRDSGEVNRQIVRLYYTWSSSDTLSSTFRLSGFNFLPQISWFGPAVGILLSFMPPIIAFSTFLFSPRSRTSISFGMLAAIGIVLAAGTTLLGGAYEWMLLKVPYFSVFMFPFRANPITALAFTALLCLGLTSILTRISGVGRGIFLVVQRLNQKDITLPAIRPVSVAILGILVLGSSAPYFIFPGYMQNALQTYSFNNGELSAYSFLQNTPGDCRIAMFPLIGDVQPQELPHAGADPMAIYPPKPAVEFAGGATDVTDSAALTRLLSMASYTKGTDSVDRILGLMNVCYVVYNRQLVDDSFTSLYRPQFGGDQTKLLDGFLYGQNGLQKAYEQGSVVIFKNPSYLPHIEAVRDVTLVSGDRSSIFPLGTIDQLNPRNTVFVLAQQVSTSGLDGYAAAPNRIVVVDNNIMDLISSLLPSRYLIDPGQFAIQTARLRPTFPYRAFGWVPGALEWWAKSRYPAGVGAMGVLTSTTASMTIPTTVDLPGPQEAWALVYRDPSSGNVGFYMDGSPLRIFDAHESVDAGFQWVPLGNVKLNQGTHELRIDNNHGESEVLQILLAPQSILDQARQSSQTLFNNSPLLLLRKLPPNAKTFQSIVSVADAYFVPGADNVNLANYTHSIVNGSLVVSAPFKGNQDTNEAIIGHLPIPSFPFGLAGLRLSIDYRVDSSYAQVFYPKFELDTTGSGKVDTIVDYLSFNPYPHPQAGTNQVLTVDLNNILSSLNLPPSQASKVKLLGLSLIFQKPENLNNPQYWVDLSGQPPTNYQFTISKVEISGSSNQVNSLATFGYATIGGSDQLLVPKSDSYDFYIRALATNQTSVRLLINGQQAGEISLSPSPSYEWQKVGTAFLAEGSQNVTLIHNGGALVDLMMARSSSDPGPPSATIPVSYQQVDPSEYSVQVESKVPYFLVFVENFDPAWALSTGNQVVKPIIANSFANMFYVPHSSSAQTLHLSYGRQKFLSLGEISTGLSFLSLTALVFSPTVQKFNLDMKLLWNKRRRVIGQLISTMKRSRRNLRL
jgi:hypothetical protein